MAAPVLLNYREVAERLNISTRTVWRWTALGELPAPVRMGRSGRVVRWKATDIDKYLKRVLAQRTETAQDNFPLPLHTR